MQRVRRSWGLKMVVLVEGTVSVARRGEGRCGRRASVCDAGRRCICKAVCARRRAGVGGGTLI
jgi:hypothetical protein